MRVQIVNDIPDKLYQEVAHFPTVKIYHCREWHQFLHRTFGWKVKALIASNSTGALDLFLPYVSKPRLDCRKHHICLPFSHSSVGPLSSNAVELHSCFTTDFPLSELEIQDALPGQNFPQQVLNYIVELPLGQFQDSEALFRQLSKDSIQRKIKKARRHGIEIRQSQSVQDCQIFTELSLETSLKHGVPAYPRAFFPNLYQCFKNTDFLKIYLAYDQGTAVAGVVFFHYQGRATYAYGASRNQPELFRIGVNQLVMWEAIEQAWREGMHLVDFGKTPLAFRDLLNYKLKWGGKASPVAFTYIGSKQQRVRKSIKRDGKMVQTAALVFRSLPRSVYRHLSPLLLKWII